MSSSHHLTILRTSSLTIRENPRKRLGVGQLQILSPVVDSLSNRVNGCRWAVCETAAKLTSCRAAISPLRLCRVWMRPDLTGMLVRLHASLPTVRRVEAVCLDGWRGVTRAKWEIKRYERKDITMKRMIFTLHLCQLK